MRNWTLRKQIVQNRIEKQLNKQKEQWYHLMPERVHESWRADRFQRRLTQRMRQDVKEKLGSEGLANLNRPGDPIHPSVSSFIGSFSYHGQ